LRRIASTFGASAGVARNEALAVVVVDEWNDARSAVGGHVREPRREREVHERSGDRVLGEQSRDLDRAHRSKSQRVERAASASLVPKPRTVTGANAYATNGGGPADGGLAAWG